MYWASRVTLVLAFAVVAAGCTAFGYDTDAAHRKSELYRVLTGLSDRITSENLTPGREVTGTFCPVVSDEKMHGMHLAVADERIVSYSERELEPAGQHWSVSLRYGGYLRLLDIVFAEDRLSCRAHLREDRGI
ncbi:MAG: hypothetical protein ABL962_20365 [Fimbriimonadaceae bacterium]